ncbi:hypothetical protein Tco_0462372 [Tanacetum coccineum]
MLPEWGRFVKKVKLNRGLRDSNYDQLYAYLKQHEEHANENKMMLDRFTQHTIDPLTLMLNVSHQQYYSQSFTTLSSTHGRHNRGPRNNVRGTGVAGYGGAQNKVGNANPDKMLLMQAQENGVALDEEQFLFIVGGQDITIMENLSSAEPVYDEAGLSHDSDILSKDNAESIGQSNVCYVPNDAYMMIINEMHEQTAKCVTVNNQNKVVNASLTAELARYKEQVELYERRAKFELTEREQKIEKQLRIVITDRNIKEENLKKELHYVKMQLNSTINHNKSMVEEVTSLKTDFKRKENKYLEEFLDMKALKEKVEDRLFKQDQSLQTVHMLCKPRSHYDEQKKNLIKPVKRESHPQDSLKGKGVLNKQRHVISPRFSDMYDAFNAAQTRIAEHESENSNLKNKIQNDDHDKHNDADPILDLKALDSQNKDLNAKVNALHDLHECFRAENEKVKQHYKELYDSIKIICAKTIDKTNSLLTEIEKLKAQIKENSKCVTIPDGKPKELALDRYAIYVEPIPPRNKTKRNGIYVLSQDTLRKCRKCFAEIVEEGSLEKTALG